MQGMVTGVRGLCNGLGPAVFGVIFYLFNVAINGEIDWSPGGEQIVVDPDSEDKPLIPPDILPGPPFLFGGCSVILGNVQNIVLYRVRYFLETSKTFRSITQFKKRA